MTHTYIHTAKNCSLEIEGIDISFVCCEGKIYFTKKELSNIYGVSKSYIKEELADSVYKKVKVGDTVKKYYSIDAVIVLGYKLTKFKETKALILLNRYIHLGGTTETLLTRMKKLYKNMRIPHLTV